MLSARKLIQFRPLPEVLVRYPGARWVLLLAPVVLYLLAVFAYPVSNVISISLFDPGLTLQHYERIVRVPVYLQVLWNTLRVAFGVTVVTLLLAYPLAYVLSVLPARTASLLMALVVLPWWTSILVRSYAWMVLLGGQGLVNRTLMNWGIISEPLPLMFNVVGVYIGMVHILLPYMIFSLYSVMKGINRDLLKAAQSLGASPFRAFLHVYLPLSMPGVAGGCLLVFILAAGFYVTPALLGSPRETMIAQLIATQIRELLAWGLGAALATMLLAITVAILLVYDRFLGLDRLPGRTS